jgi:hypothetical protein
MRTSFYTAALVGLLSSGLAYADVPTSGNYEGKGQWRDSSGNSGEYTVETIISSEEIESRYGWASGSRNWGFSLQNQSVGFYAVTDNFGTEGKMYCYSVQCHYEFVSAHLTTEETLSFVDGKLYKLGSKRMPNGTVVTWQEALTLK